MVDDAGRDQYLLGVWRTAALRAAVADVAGPTSLRRVLAPLTVGRLASGAAPPASRPPGPIAIPRPISSGPGCSPGPGPG